MTHNEPLNQLSSEALSKVPVEDLVRIILDQFAQLQAQTALIQAQAEQISAMQKTIEELKDEISRLNNTPKRPKFRAGGMEPRNRSKKRSLIIRAMLAI